MQVRTRAASRVTTESDRITGANLLILCYQLLGHVTVDSLQSVIVTDHDILTIAASLIAYDTYLTAESSTDGITDIHLDVKTFVLASPTGTEVAGQHATGCRHAEVTQVNAERVWKNGSLVGIAVVPVIIKVGCGILITLSLEKSFECHAVDSFHPAVDRGLFGKQVLSHNRCCHYS